MNDIQKKTYIDKDETDSTEKNKQMKKKQIVCTYNNETSKDYKQYTILSMIISTSTVGADRPIDYLCKQTQCQSINLYCFA